VDGRAGGADGRPRELSLHFLLAGIGHNQVQRRLVLGHGKRQVRQAQDATVDAGALFHLESGHYTARTGRKPHDVDEPDGAGHVGGHRQLGVLVEAKKRELLPAA